MKFNHVVNRSNKPLDPMEEQLMQKQDPHEILNDIENLASNTRRSGKREELELADKFKQRVLHDFERDGRKYSKEWIVKMTNGNGQLGGNVIQYTRRMREIDDAFTRMKNKDCEMDIEEMVTAVTTSYNQNNDCLAKLSIIEGQMIELSGKIEKDRNELVGNLERISKLNNQRQLDDETKLRIENLIKSTTQR